MGLNHDVAIKKTRMAYLKQIDFILKGKPTCTPHWNDLALGNNVNNMPHRDLDQLGAEVNLSLDLA